MLTGLMFGLVVAWAICFGVLTKLMLDLSEKLQDMSGQLNAMGQSDGTERRDGSSFR